jgi:hypothetical protein
LPTKAKDGGAKAVSRFVFSHTFGYGIVSRYTTASGGMGPYYTIYWFSSAKSTRHYLWHDVKIYLADYEQKMSEQHEKDQEAKV